jgi:hypothetical protein
MKDRFTHDSRLGRGKIPREMRLEVFERDDFTCQFCGTKLSPELLTIDHLIPISLGGHDEMTNYISCCSTCNQSKANTPLSDFAKTINISIDELPVHGDPVIDNLSLPIQIRLLRKRIFDKARAGELNITGKTAQKKLEKAYRREFWQTPEGNALEAEFVNLPGHVRIMIPEIQTVAKNEREFLLLVELAKSANTRSLIGSILVADSDVEQRLRSVEARTNDAALKKRIQNALKRFERECQMRNL